MENNDNNGSININNVIAAFVTQFVTPIIKAELEEVRNVLKEEIARNVESAMESYDFESDVESIIKQHDFSQEVYDAVSEHDFSSDIDSALRDYDFSDEIENAVDSALEERDIAPAVSAPDVNQVREVVVSVLREMTDNLKK